MKKIGINMSHYWVMGWFWVVATNIINELLKSDEYEFYLLSTEKKELPGDLRNKKNIHRIISDVKFYFVYRLWTQASLLKKHKIDIFYTPDQIVPLRKVCKYISTIHDLYLWKNFRWINAFKLNGSRGKIYYFMPLDKYYAKNSDYIITPSIDSKNDIIKYLKVKSEKIILWHWWMNHMESVNVENKKDYILFPLCSDFDNHFIFRLWDEIIKRNYTESVIYWKPHNNVEPMPNPQNDRIKMLMDKISDKEKEILISEAKLAVYVSEMEWFWFPPLECQILWCPVIYHKIWSLEEIVWDSGIWINGLNINDYLKQIEKIVNDDVMYNKVRNLWYKNAKSYYWDGVVNIIKWLFEKNLWNLK